MATGFDKIIKSVLKDRTSTPLYSSLLLSWCLWNSRIIYFTIFVSQDKIPGNRNKLEYVEANFIDPLYFYILPLVSTALFIFAFPYAANYTYKKSLEFKRRRINDRNEIIEKDRLLTPAESEEIRVKAEAMVSKKEEKILELSNLVNGLHAEKQNLISELSSFKIVSARYGSDAGHWLDVVDKIKIVSGRPSIKIHINNTTFSVGDPAPGFIKEFKICVRFQNRFIQNNAIEGDTVNIVLASGEINITRGQNYQNLSTILNNSKHKFRL